MIELVISGGQTGADRAGLDAAIVCGVPHGGWCPKGRKADDGVIPEQYRLQETEGESYLSRTERNVKRSDGTVVFTMGGLTGGSARTMDFARRHRRPHVHLALRGIGDDQVVLELRTFVVENSLRILNVAGSSGSSEPEIHARVLGIMCRLLSETGGD